MTGKKNTNTMLDDVSREIASKEHPEYDGGKREIFISGFADGYHQAEKNPFNQELDSSALEDIKHLEVAEKTAYLSGFNRGFNYRLENIDKNTSKSEKKDGKISVSQENFVSLQKENIIDYGTNSNRRAEEVASEHEVRGRHERLGVRAYVERGRPTLDCRWDTELYEEGLPSSRRSDQLGSPQSAIRSESDRLIDVAKQHEEFFPSAIWETFGSRFDGKSSESVVFFDKKNSRVVKFKDPFIYTNFKHKNPYCALYEHHIHNYLFGNVPYRLLGISQDPNSGNARFVFEQPFIRTAEKPSLSDIRIWMKRRGFEYGNGGYTDGFVSIIDTEGDNCIKGDDGKLYFIDPIIRFEQEPKEVIKHYIERDRELSEKLDKAGIKVGTRFRIDRLCSFNDMQVKDINLAHGLITFFHPTTHPDYQGEFEWPIRRVLENIRLSQGSRWIQVDENRQDIVIPQAKRAILERTKDPSPHTAFTDSQVKALDRYCALFSDTYPREKTFMNLLSDMKPDFRREGIYDEWVDDVKSELTDLANGIRRENGVSLRRS